MSENRKIELLEAFRGLAAVWVLMHHAWQATNGFIGPASLGSFVQKGFLGVDFFFVLSGFIISYSSLKLVARGGGFQDYLNSRIVRVYVPHLPVGCAMYFAYLVLPGLSEAGGRDVGLVTSLSLLPTNNPPALSVAWTLVHEVIFYLLFGVWFFSRRVFWVVASAWLLLIVSVFMIGIEYARFVGYFVSPLNLCFLLGVVVHQISQRVDFCRVASILFLLLGFALVSLAVCAEDSNRWSAAIGFCLIVLSASGAAFRDVSVFGWLAIAGAASYSIYLIHNPALSVFARAVSAFFPGVEPWFGFLTISIASLVAGLLYWTLFERWAVPLMGKWLKRGRRIAES